MNYNRKNQKRTPLLVKEVVFPDKGKRGTGECLLKESSGTASNHLQNEMEKCVRSTVNSVVKIGDHEVKSVGELIILEKKPLENYFGGTAIKKQIKRKNKTKRETQSLRILDCKESQTESNGTRIKLVMMFTRAVSLESNKRLATWQVAACGPKVSPTGWAQILLNQMVRQRVKYKNLNVGEEVPFVSKQPFKKREVVVKDEKIEKKTLLRKIDTFEKMREHKYQNVYVRQRLAEDKYIQQQENLAETWLEFLKRRKQLKNINPDDVLTYREHFCGKTSQKHDRFCISIIPREYWNDDQANKFFTKPEKHVEKREETSRPTSNQSKLDNFEETFFEKLVFVDVEDSDD